MTWPGPGRGSGSGAPIVTPAASITAAFFGLIQQTMPSASSSTVRLGRHPRRRIGMQRQAGLVPVDPADRRREVRHGGQPASVEIVGRRHERDQHRDRARAERYPAHQEATGLIGVQRLAEVGREVGVGALGHPIAPLQLDDVRIARLDPSPERRAGRAAGGDDPADRRTELDRHAESGVPAVTTGPRSD